MPELGKESGATESFAIWVSASPTLAALPNQYRRTGRGSQSAALRLWEESVRFVGQACSLSRAEWTTWTG